MYLKKVILFLFIPLAFLNAREYNLSADIYSRYVWRGTDYGNSLAIQPSIETSFGQLTIGAWGSYSIAPGFLSSDTTYDASGSECDLFASFSVGSIDFTITDYFFPAGVEGDKLFELSGDDATHTFELSAGSGIGLVSVLVARNVLGDNLNSTYLELNFGVFSLGLGDGDYSTKGEFTPVSLGISTSRDNLSVSYIINPDQETSFLVFGLSF
jgi:hypothetical protein